MPDFNLGDAIRNAKPTSFAPIPAANYEVTVESAEFVFSKAGGNPMFKVTLVVDEGQEHSGRKLWANIVFTEKTIDMAVGNLAVLGIDQADLAVALAEGGDPADICQQLVDAQAVVKVVVKEDDVYGAKNEIKRWIKKPGAADPTANRVPAPASAARPARPF